MDPRRIDELYLRALDLPEGERRRFLESECTDEPAVLAEVLSLLEHSPEDFLEQSEHLTETDRVEGYELVRVLGEGGMGVVWLAEQREPIERTVALKLIKLGMDTHEVVQRFEAERQALALMSHSGIARVFDAGATERGRPYFAMEYVDGTAITRFCDERRLDVTARLELFAELCDAVQHAHQKGILHRDIKPSNVLVSLENGRPRPKVIDFGISRATDQRATVHTQVGQIVGTPEYMSPEQADFGRVDIDTRTDVYSLGVLLYELLVGHLPFEAGELRRSGYDEMCRRIREVEPPRPSSRLMQLEAEELALVSQRRRTDRAELTRKLRGDLDWVILTALAKQRSHRYSSVSELAGDVRRYLRLEPVQARPPSALYRTGKFIRRHRGFVVAAALVTAALIAGIVGTSVGMLRARRAQVEALEEAARATREARTAREIVGVVQDGLDDPARLRAIGQELRRRQLLREARAFLERSLALLEESQGAAHPDVLANLNDLGALSADLQDHDEAIAWFRRALPLAEARFGRDDPDYVAGLLKNLGDAHENLGELDAAREQLERALRIRGEHFGPRSLKVAITMSSLGNVLVKAGEHEAAIATLAESVAIRREAAPDNARGLGFGLYFLGEAQQSAGRHADARESLQAAVEAWEEGFGAEHANVGNALYRLAVVDAELGERERAHELLARARAIDDASFDPLNPDEAPTLLESLTDHAALLEKLNYSGEARDLRARAKRIRSRTSR